MVTATYDISHKTTYRYATPVVHSDQRLHLAPRAMPNQTINAHALLIEPAPTHRRDGVDSFGNPISVLEIDREHSTFTVQATSRVTVVAAPRVELAQSMPWEDVAHLLRCGPPPHDIDIVQFTSSSRLTMPSLAIADFALQSFTPGRPVLEAAFDLTRRIFTEFRFDPTATDVSTPVTEVLRLKRGVCQDFSHLALAALRALRLPARYISGYLLTRPPPGVAKLRGADASHAWIAVWAPGHGWVQFDPTNGIVPTDEHIAFAHGRDYDDINPVSGVILGGADHTVSVAVDVDPV
ncbi:MAG: transglutaminase N-terminal domain-containing protein [Hyphomicrobiaceae bacterium]